MRWVTVGVFLLACVPVARAQWILESAPSNADLRGIANAGNGVAWASGSGGTVLRTTDGGERWERCATPPDAERLDFRGIQAFDASTAVVMSSGKGTLSRLYKTRDGCRTWTLVATNPDADGFWDGMAARVRVATAGDVCDAGSRMIEGAILGDPVVRGSSGGKAGRASLYLADFEAGIDCAKDKLGPSAAAIFAQPIDGAFAASNSGLALLDVGTYWIAAETRLIEYSTGFADPGHYAVQNFCEVAFPVSHHTESSGIFSLAIRPGSVEPEKGTRLLEEPGWKEPTCRKANMVVVGGDYTAPDNRKETAAWTGGKNKFEPARTMPGGFRSAVAWDAAARAWIAVGPNGTDVSTDDGRDWRAVHPAGDDAADADRRWNALSLPFVVGPRGRIGKLRAGALGR
ncbi:MAG TPA: hypothetical protein VHZ25_18710 [Acidobacteriaceae bacterium]|jgi:photosystem II stability/assembly factor-like uncharacterized protein|nr:hypothetical protein [Acidobacteriaceae bacterium]